MSCFLIPDCFVGREDTRPPSAKMPADTRNDGEKDLSSPSPLPSPPSGEREFKPYYVAHTKIQTLALLDDRYKGSNWSRWWTRSQPIRTTAEIQAHIKILPAKLPYLYQKVAKKAIELHLLGLSYIKIGKILNIDPKTAKKACKHK